MVKGQAQAEDSIHYKGVGMDVRTCRNGHTGPVLTYTGSTKLRCLECERARCARYFATPGTLEKKREWDRERKRKRVAGWV